MCPCEGVSDPLELARCLAPPPGEHELAIETGLGSTLVVTGEGFRLRATVRDEWLPFLDTVERPASRVAVESALRSAGLEPGELPRLAAEKLVEAARSGSRVAAEKLRACKELVKELLGDGAP